MADTGDRAEMAPGATSDAMAVLANAAHGLRGAWESAGRALAGAEGQLGAGPMGQAFMTRYAPGAPMTAAMLDLSVKALEHHAGVGFASVADYVAADDAGRAAFDSIG